MKLLVPSCTAYRATWEPFKAFLEHSWPDCPYELWIASEGDDGDRGWCSNLLGYLEQIEDEHVLMVLDDHWIDGDVLPVADTTGGHFGHGTGCIRYHPSPGHGGEREWELHPKGMPYRISTAPSIWNVNYLREITQGVLDAGFNSAQEFELVGSIMSNFASEWQTFIPRNDFRPIPFINSAIVKGKWNKRAIERAAEIGVTVDTSGREIG